MAENRIPATFSAADLRRRMCEREARVVRERAVVRRGVRRLHLADHRVPVLAVASLAREAAREAVATSVMTAT